MRTTIAILLLVTSSLAGKEKEFYKFANQKRWEKALEYVTEKVERDWVIFVKSNNYLEQKLYREAFDGFLELFSIQTPLRETARLRLWELVVLLKEPKYSHLLIDKNISPFYLKIRRYEKKKLFEELLLLCDKRLSTYLVEKLVIDENFFSVTQIEKIMQNCSFSPLSLLDTGKIRRLLQKLVYEFRVDEVERITKHYPSKELFLFKAVVSYIRNKAAFLNTYKLGTDPIIDKLILLAKSDSISKFLNNSFSLPKWLKRAVFLDRSVSYIKEKRFDKLVTFLSKIEVPLNSKYVEYKLFSYALKKFSQGDRNFIKKIDTLLQNSSEFERSLHYWSLLSNRQNSWDKSLIDDIYQFSIRANRIQIGSENQPIELTLSINNLERYTRANYFLSNGFFYLASLELLGHKSHRETNYLLAKAFYRTGDFDLAIRRIVDIFPQLEGYGNFEFDKQIWTLAYPTPFKAEVIRLSSKYGLSPTFVYAVIRQESKFDIYALSVSDAHGLMQIIPSTAFYLASKLKLTDFTLDKLYSISINLEMGIFYLKSLLDRFGNPVIALAAYNAGPGRVTRFLRKNKFINTIDYFVDYFPFYETRNYLRKVTYYWNVYKYLYPALETGYPRLEYSFRR